MRNGVLPAVALAAATLGAACRDVTAPARPAPTTARFAAQPSKGVWTVTTLDDPGTGSCASSYCTLRDAVNAAQDGDKIVFKSGVSGTIALTTALIFDDKGLTIDGGGRITLDGQNLYNSSVIWAYGHVKSELIGLTLTGDVNVQSGGGGVLVDPGTTLTLTNTKVTGNQANRGGAIYNMGTLNIVQSTIADNSASADGGGVYNDGGTLTVTGSTISGNSAELDGGGIYNTGPAVTITASTISENTAPAGGGIFQNGDAFSLVQITSSTITGNSTGTAFPQGAGGINAAIGPVQLRNSIIAGNVVYDPFFGQPFASDCVGGAITSLGYNLTVGGCPVGSTDKAISLAQVSTEVLDPNLTDNGGPTKTHALIERGLAVDVGYCPGETKDQRGFTRPYDDTRLSNAADACDIGAFEWQPPPSKRSK